MRVTRLTAIDELLNDSELPFSTKSATLDTVLDNINNANDIELQEQKVLSYVDTLNDWNYAEENSPEDDLYMLKISAPIEHYRVALNNIKGWCHMCLMFTKIVSTVLVNARAQY